MAAQISGPCHWSEEGSNRHSKIKQSGTLTGAGPLARQAKTHIVDTQPLPEGGLKMLQNLQNSEEPTDRQQLIRMCSTFEAECSPECRSSKYATGLGDASIRTHKDFKDAYRKPTEHTSRNNDRSCGFQTSFARNADFGCSGLQCLVGSGRHADLLGNTAVSATDTPPPAIDAVRAIPRMLQISKFSQTSEIRF